MLEAAGCLDAPRVFITPEAKRRLDSYIGLCPDEISGLGEVVRRGADLLITSVVLFPQVVTAGSTDLNQDQIQNFLLELVRSGQDPSTFKLWWHSHVYGQCYWSGTDHATCSRFNNEWMLSVLGNKHGDYRCRLDLFNPFRITIDRLPMEILNLTPPDLQRAIEAEIREKVKKKKMKRGRFFQGIGSMKDHLDTRILLDPITKGEVEHDD